MYSLTHSSPVVGREMTAGGSTQIFSLCWASLSSVHTPASTPLYLTVSGTLSHCPVSILCVPLCVCMSDSVYRNLVSLGVLHRALVPETHKCSLIFLFSLVFFKSSCLICVFFKTLESGRVLSWYHRG